MKKTRKILCAISVLGMILTSSSAVSVVIADNQAMETAADTKNTAVEMTDTAEAAAVPGGGMASLAGGWTLAEDTAVTQEAEDALAKALESFVGSNIEPVALLGEQVVAGINYCMLCRVTAVTPTAVPKFALVYVYAGVNGNCELLGISDLDIAGIYSGFMQAE